MRGENRAHSPDGAATLIEGCENRSEKAPRKKCMYDVVHLKPKGERLAPGIVAAKLPGLLCRGAARPWPADPQQHACRHETQQPS